MRVAPYRIRLSVVERSDDDPGFQMVMAQPEDTGAMFSSGGLWRKAFAEFRGGLRIERHQLDGYSVSGGFGAAHIDGFTASFGEGIAIDAGAIAGKAIDRQPWAAARRIAAR